MSNHQIHLSDLDVDEAWIVGWANDGVLAIELYLAKHAAFADFLLARDDLHLSDGDGRQDV
jgi:predicted nucleic-acid-binding protein